MEKLKVYFRTDVSSEIGMGHFSRCIGLADIVKDFLDPVFIMQQFNPVCKGLCKEKNYEFIELPTEIKPSDDLDEIDKNIIDGSLVVLDGYHFGTDLQLYLKKKDCKVISNDDIHAHHFYSDVVINHGGGTKEDYSVEPYTQLFLGLNYAILKNEFIEAAKLRRPKSEIKNILIAIGGTDPNHYSAQLADWLIDLEQIEQINILTTTANKNIIALVDYCNAEDKLNIHIDLPTAEVIDLLLENDLAILPASTICIEACAVGIGIICGITAENQYDMYKALTRTPAVLGMDKLINISDQKMKSVVQSLTLQDVNDMIKHQRKLVDGRSHERIREIFKKLC